MDYTVKQLPPRAGGSPIYQLLGPDGAELLRAEQSTGSHPDERRQLRLVQPNDRLAATMDLSQATVTDDGKREGDSDYAIIHDYAVYAILGVRQRPVSDEQQGGAAYFTLEVEGGTWLILPNPESEGCYALYDEFPVGLNTYDTLTDIDLPPAFGSICRVNNSHAFEIDLSQNRLQHTAFIALALAFLIDQSSGND